MAQEYAKLVKRAGLLAAVCATTLIIIKLFAWFVTGSASILASVTDSIMDLAATGVNLLAIRYALQPADKEHHYGHGKAESLAGLAQAAFIAGSVFLLFLHGADRLINPQPIKVAWVGLWVSGISIVLTFVLIMYQNYVVKLTDSIVIKADALHYRTDLILNTVVMIAIVLVWQGLWWADGLFAMAVAIFIGKSAYELAMTAVNELLDHKLPDEEEEHIKETILSSDGVLGLHDLKTRKGGNTRFIEFHLELDDELSLYHAHEIAEQVEQKVASLFEQAHVISHLDPYSIVQQEA